MLRSQLSDPRAVSRPVPAKSGEMLPALGGGGNAVKRGACDLFIFNFEKEKEKKFSTPFPFIARHFTRHAIIGKKKKERKREFEMGEKKFLR